MNAKKLNGYHRCPKYREHALPVGPGGRLELAARQSKLKKDFIRGHMPPNRGGAGLANSFFCQEYRKLPFKNRAMADTYAMEAALQVQRYLGSENRTPDCIPSQGKPLKIGNSTVYTNPDLVFMEGYDGKPCVEAVALKCKAPDVTQTGKKLDSGAKQNLELYAIIKWAESYAREKGCPDGTRIGASLYFLKKKNDRSGSMVDMDFFNTKGAGNVVSLWTTLGKDDAVMEKLSMLFTEFEEGVFEECEENCKYCPYLPCCQETDCVREETYTGEPGNAEKNQVPATDIRLNSGQESAVSARQGTIRCNAGAGTGKTLMLAMRATRMILDGVEPPHICMLTFTEAAAEEMSARVAQYLKDFGYHGDPGSLVSTTFDSFWYQLVKSNYRALGFSAEPQILADRTDRMCIIEKLMARHPVSGLNYKAPAMKTPNYMGAFSMMEEAISLVKKGDIRPGDDATLEQALHRKGILRFGPGSHGYRETWEFYAAYQDYLLGNNLVEYADLPNLVNRLLETDPGLFEHFGFEHIMVDEYQDVDPVQFRLVKRLESCPSEKSFLVVGDDSQSIYAFRGSSPEQIIHFHEYMGKPGKDIDLLVNYRSSRDIIEFANGINALNENRVDKTLEAGRPYGCPVAVNAFTSRQEEYRYIVSEALGLHKTGIPYKDMAFIARNRSELTAMQDLFLGNGIPCSVISPEPLMEDREVSGLVALARFFLDPSDTEDGYRAAVAFGCKDDREAAEWMVWMNCTMHRVNNMDDAGQQKEVFLATLRELVTGESALFFLERLGKKATYTEAMGYCARFGEYGENDTYKHAPGDGIVLTTAHSSKGLEWPVVFNSISSYYKQGTEKEELEEARRLLFVSATRARDRLYITGQEMVRGGKNGAVNLLLQECVEILAKKGGTA